MSAEHTPKRRADRPATPRYADGPALDIDPGAGIAGGRLLAQDWARLKEALLADGDEHAAILVCGIRDHAGALTYLVRETICLGPQDYLRQGADHLAISPVTIARHAKYARSTDAAIILVHCHPNTGAVAASGIDLRTEADLYRRVLTARTGKPSAALIIGPEGVDGRSWTSAGATPVTGVRLIGSRLERVAVTSRGVPAPAQIGTTTASIYGATDRQELLWGVEGQRNLAHAHVVVIGCGGTGSHIGAQLAHLGLGRLTLIDDDHVEASNLSRIIGAGPADIGRDKVDTLADYCRCVNPSIDITTLSSSVLDVDPSVYIDADVVVCATDSHGSRSLLTEVCTQYLIPLVDLGVEVVPGSDRFQAGGGVRVVIPGQGCLWCAQTLSPALVREEYLSPSERAAEARRGYLRGSDAPAPSVIALNGVVSSLAVLEICQLLVGMLGGGACRLLYRAEQRSLTTASIPRNPDCHVCGRDARLAAGDSLPVNTRPARHARGRSGA